MSASSRIFNPQGKFCSKRFFAKLKHWMEHHPVVSNSILCLNLWVAGDALAQYSEHKLLHSHEHAQQQFQLQHGNKVGTTSTTTSEGVVTKNMDDNKEDSVIDPIRLLTSAGYGAFVYGPILAIWYPWLDKMCKAYKISARYGLWGAPIAKVLADEIIMTPPCLFLFFGYMNTVEGGTIEKYKSKLEGEFFSSWLASITFWPPISLATFRFLPVYAQAPVINAVCIIWDAFLSHRNAVANINEKLKEQQQEPEELTDTTADAMVVSNTSAPSIPSAATAAVVAVSPRSDTE